MIDAGEGPTSEAVQLSGKVATVLKGHPGSGLKSIAARSGSDLFTTSDALFVLEFGHKAVRRTVSVAVKPLAEAGMSANLQRARWWPAEMADRKALSKRH